jgi:hypothetical protein
MPASGKDSRLGRVLPQFRWKYRQPEHYLRYLFLGVFLEYRRRLAESHYDFEYEHAWASMISIMDSGTWGT